MPPPPPPPMPRRTAFALAVLAAVACVLGVALPRWLPHSPPPVNTAADVAAGTPVDEPSSAATGSTVGWALMAGGGLAVVAFLFVKSRLRPAAAIPGGAVEFYSALAVDAQCTVTLVRAGSRRLLIGHDASGVKAMIELPGGLGVAGEPAVAAVRIPASAVPGPIPVPGGVR